LMTGTALLLSGTLLLSSVTPAVAVPMRTLAVAVVGPGSVTSTPAGISCPGHCTATFSPGTSVMLSATPGSGSTFLRWGGACAGTVTCHVDLTSSLVSVAAQFEAGRALRHQPVPTRSVAAPGSYSAPESPGHFYGFSFFVSPGGSSLLNVAVIDIVGCTPAGSFPGSDQLVIPQVAIQPNGSFAATAAQQGVFDNAMAKFTYSFAGRFKPATPAGPPTAAGTLRDTVVFAANGTTETCTTNVQPWAATHDPQAAPTASAAVPGSYSAPESAGHFYGFSFFVSPGGTSLENVAVTDIVSCTPAGSFPGSSQLVIPELPVLANGSFSGTATRQGVFGDAPAKFDYSFAGHVEGATPNGPLTVAGTLREDVVFQASGTTETCTTNLQPWTATHDPQPVPTESAAVAGSYSAGESAGHFYGFSFSVSPGGRSLTNISVADIVACTPAGSFPDSSQLVITEVGIRPNGSFAATTSQQGVFDNAKAKFTYSFAGYFEGATPSGPETVAGTLREDIVFPANGTTESCTTNDQPWVATRSS
jgi:Divergent InlB B-repeat domain